VEQRFDLVLWVNGFPLVVGEAKTPKRPAVTWLDGADQIHNRYERNVAALFVPNVLSFATEGKELYFGEVRRDARCDAPLPHEDCQRVTRLVSRQARRRFVRWRRRSSGRGRAPSSPAH
jgi:hypothetical protein